MSRSAMVAVLLLTCLGVVPSIAADWPQWRGPARDGAAVHSALPDNLPASLTEVWSREVGTGHASPVVVGDRLYVHARVDDREVVRALDMTDGSELWSWSSETPYKRHPAALSHGKGPKSTPVVAGDTLCTLGVTGRAACFDRGTGELLWQRAFEGRFDRAWPDFGTATSPAVFGDRLVFHVGGKQTGALIAVDARSGEELWAWTGGPPAYTSPILATLDGVEQIVTQSRAHVIALAPETGELLWQTPFETAYEQNSVTPLAVGDRVIVSGLDQGVAAYEPRRDGRGNWVLGIAWRNDEVPMYMSSPVVRDGLLFGMTDKRKGQLFCLDLETGETLWTSEGREGENVALILAGDRLLVQSDEATLKVGRAAGDGWDAEATYEIADSPTWAHPALVGDRLVVKDKERVRVLSFAP